MRTAGAAAGFHKGHAAADQNPRGEAQNQGANCDTHLKEQPPNLVYQQRGEIRRAKLDAQ